MIFHPKFLELFWIRTSFEISRYSGNISTHSIYCILVNANNQQKYKSKLNPLPVSVSALVCCISWKLFPLTNHILLHFCHRKNQFEAVSYICCDWFQCFLHFQQAWAIQSFGQKYYTQYYTEQKYTKLYNTLYQYYTKSRQLISSVKQHQTAIFKLYLRIK